MKKIFRSALLLLILAAYVLSFVACGEPGDTPSEEGGKSYKISYETDGGSLPDGKWDTYSDKEDFVLPVPEREGYVFSGWFTSSDLGVNTNCATIPRGSSGDIKLYAKWNEIISDLDASALVSETSRIALDHHKDNGLTVSDGVAVWQQGTTAISQISLNGSLIKALGSSDQVTFELDLARSGDAQAFQSFFRLRAGNDTVILLTTKASGEIFLGKSQAYLTTLTDDLQRIRIVVDFKGETVGAYNKLGKKIASIKLDTSAFGITGEEYRTKLMSIIWQWVTDKPSVPSAISVGRVAVTAGNSAERGTGMPVTLIDGSFPTDYRIIFSSASSDASVAAGDLAYLLTQNGIAALDKFSDSADPSAHEILIGETNRAQSEELKSFFDGTAMAEADNYVWAFLYKGGKLAVMANSDVAYELALLDLKTRFLRDGGLVLASDLVDVCFADKDDVILESLIDPDPHAAHMSYTVYDNFFDGYSDPFGMSDSDYRSMILSHVSYDTYRISYSDDRGGVFSADFVKKRWGCWMMGAIKYVDKKGVSNPITSSSTDYEFVLHCGSKTSANTVRGGNHGDYTLGDSWDADDTTKSNDRLLDLAFYDGKSGESVSLNVGESKRLDGVRIVMHTNIYELDYKQENVLINVEKSYLYNGYDILCDSKLYMAQDVSFEQSNACMLPISKMYGNCMLTYNLDGTTTYAKTGLVGNTKKPIVRGIRATKVELWGENNPTYHLTVEILNPDQQMISNDALEGYVKLWDMNTNSNKVYFSFLTSPRTLEWGTELNLKNKWTFSIADGFVGLDREPDRLIGIE